MTVNNCWWKQLQRGIDLELIADRHLACAALHTPTVVSDPHEPLNGLRFALFSQYKVENQLDRHARKVPC